MEDKGNSGNTATEAADLMGSPSKKTPKSKATTKAQRPKSSHPPTSEMVNSAIKELKDRKGSSFQAIKKYIAATYKVDGEKLAPFIKRYLKSAVTSGAVVQTKGKGASGSFKLSTGKTVEPKAKAPRAPKVAAPKKAKKSVEKKTTPVRKPAAATKKAATSPAKKPVEPTKRSAAKRVPAKPAAAEKKVESKAAPKAKKTAKAPAAKTKTPKPKKTAASKTAKATGKK